MLQPHTDESSKISVFTIVAEPYRPVELILIIILYLYII